LKKPTAFIVLLLERLRQITVKMKLPKAAKKPLTLMQNTGKTMGRGMVLAGSAIKGSVSRVYRLGAKNKLFIGILLAVTILTWVTAGWYHGRFPPAEAPQVIIDTAGTKLDLFYGQATGDPQNQADPAESHDAQTQGLDAVAPKEEPALMEQEAKPALAKVDVTAMVMPLQGRAGKGYGFGYSPVFGDYRLHPGVNIVALVGKPVVAALPGKVETVEFNEFFRYRVVLDHGGGWQTVYLNLDRVEVKKGQAVAAGAVLAAVGEPGKAATEEGSHLHFQLRKDNKAMDPAPYLGIQFQTGPR
jgi:hypothetical protein